MRDLIVHSYFHTLFQLLLKLLDTTNMKKNRMDEQTLRTQAC